MIVYYFNDEQKPMSIYYHSGLSGPEAVLKPAEGAYFNVKIPKGTVPFIKKWKDYVMISYISKNTDEKVFKSSGKAEWERKRPKSKQG